MKIYKKFFVTLMLLQFFSTMLFAQLSFDQDDVAELEVYQSSSKVHQGDELTLALKLIIDEGWHTNSHKPNDEFLIPTSINIKTDLTDQKIKIIFPNAENIKLEFSDDPVSVFEGEPVFGATILILQDIELGTKTIDVEFNYQACNDKTCMAPVTIKKSLEVEIVHANVDIIRNQNEIFSKINNFTDNTLQTSETKSIETESSNISVWFALVSAFIGGLILNLMPCVLPVLSLKIFSIVQQSGEDRRKRIDHGLAFTLGVLATFWVLAITLILLRAGGEQLGWGFQLQSPAFIIILTTLLFLFGLSMFGVFEIGTSLTAVGQGSANEEGFIGSFSSGVLATIVATPCTAPFMGSALGYALSQPAYVSLLVFTFLGLGMAAPYLLLTTIPSLSKYVPKPGAWMETFKQFMGFLLMATVLWLLWVFSLQVGAEGLLILLGSFIIASIGGWIFGRWGNIAKPKPTRVKAMIAAIILILGGIVFTFNNIDANNATTTEMEQGKIKWQTFSPELVKEYLDEGKPVFIDFTAAWCLSCQVNEKVAFSSEDVQNAFDKMGVQMLKADWTNRDEVIGRELAKFGRNSVPLYVLYSGRKNAEPVLLPEIITPGIVLDALEGIGK
ncbi:MAG: DUF255 domain-containing protein [Ignavibacteriae bacterium]|nr:DUF255 domain-containing protein [Ignavibacteriota bacterium]